MINRNYSLEENVKSFNLFIDTAREILSLIELENGTPNFPPEIFLTNIKTAVNFSRYKY